MLVRSLSQWRHVQRRRRRVQLHLPRRFRRYINRFTLFFFFARNNKLKSTELSDNLNKNIRYQLRTEIQRMFESSVSQQWHLRRLRWHHLSMSRRLFRCDEKETLDDKNHLTHFPIIFVVLLVGDYCEIDASVCNDTICKNSGECVEGPGFSFYCRCREGKNTKIYLKLLLYK